MTRTPGAAPALACIDTPWAAKIAAVLRTIVETILAIAENIRNTLQQPGACCRKAAALWQPVLSRPMMSKPGFLPSSASTLHAIACRRSSEIGAGRQERSPDEAPFAEPSAIKPGTPELNCDIDRERPTCPHVKFA
jgi:hypothetical protein